MPDRKRVLVVVTSAGRLEGSKSTGLWLEEFSIAQDVFERAGHEVVVASPAGGSVPIDPASLPDEPSERDRLALAALRETRPVAEVAAHAFDALYFPGGHGTMVDFPQPPVGRLAASFAEAGKPVAAVCHGPAAFVAALGPDGRPFVAGRRLAGFTNEEERASENEHAVPFLLETRLRELGAEVETKPAWSVHVVEDGGLITGQNPQSTAEVADALLDALERL